MEILNNNTMHKILKSVFVLVIILSVFIAILALKALREISVIGDEFAPTPTIVVEGEGEVFAIPDVANFSFSVVKEESTVALAQQNVSESISQAIQTLKDSGIDEKDIKTISYNVYPRYEYVEMQCLSFPCPVSGERVLRGYEVSQGIGVKVRDIEKASGIIDSLGNIKITNLSGLSFSVDDEDKLVAEAREIAISDAKEKAKILAEQLGVRIKKIISFGDSGHDHHFARSSKAFGGEMLDVASVELPVGENKFVSNVSITYEIE